MINEPMFISPKTFRGYEQYKTDCARASGWNEAMAFIFAEELETERTRTIREKFFVVENEQTEKADRKTENNSGKLNNCEHITEDGVTCAKYPACDDCLDNPLNKVKGSERLVKGSEQTDCQTCKWWSNYGYCVHRECKGYEPQTERSE